MAASLRMKKLRYYLRLKNIPIQQRLPLMICVLLVVIVVCFSWTAYLGMKNASLKLGGERVSRLTTQLSSMFEQTAQHAVSATVGVAIKPAVVDYLKTVGGGSEEEVLKELATLRQDSLSVLIEIRDTGGGITLLRSGSEELQLDVPIDSALLKTIQSPASGTVGRIYKVGDRMYFPIVAAISDNEQNLGYLVHWRWLYATPKGIEQFSQLIGTDAMMYMGNEDMRFWTDLVNEVEAPPITRAEIPGKVLKYTRQGERAVLASFYPVRNTKWLLLLEFSSSSFLNAANTFLYWIIGVGMVLTALGIFFSWVLSRKITKPLHQLTAAATSITRGNHNFQLDITRRDELGKLAGAFQAMSVQVRAAQDDLEKKVMDRTARLEAVNKELEAFSYSISHDLRAPLRAVSGYSVMLKEDYADALDSEGNRIIGAIVSNAKMMGSLIDDLIAFSKMGRKEVVRNRIDMEAIVKACFNELSESEKFERATIEIGKLPAAYGDVTMIKQVWINLIGNALKYSSRKEHPLIQVGCTQENGSDFYFVRDNGVGFDMQYVHKLFGVFQRLHSAEDFEGTGIGLALVLRIVDKHSGEVRAEGVPGKGATFFFSLNKMITNGE